MNAQPSLPVVRLRLECADRAEYGATRAAEIAAKGVLIRSERPRAPGDRVRLEIELLDGSHAYAGPAVVRGPAGEENGAAGYRLALEGLTPAEPPRWPPAPPSGVAVGLAEYLFADLPDAGEKRGSGRLVPTPRPVRLRLAPTPPPASSVRHPTPAMRDPTPLVCLPTPLSASEPPPVVPDLEAASHARRLPAPAPHAAEEPELVSLPAPRLTARRWLWIAAGVAAVALFAGEVLLIVRAREAKKAAVVAELQRADQRIEGGQLAGPRGDSALDHLEEARRLAPDDERVKRRLALLASTFEELGGRALTRAHLAEARAHFQAALRADPGRELARAQLQRLEAAPAGAGRRTAGR